MGFASQSGQLGLKTQPSVGVYSSPGTAGIFARFRSGAMAGNRELIIPDPEIGGSRDVPDAYLGPIAFSGSFDAYARMEFLATLLKGVLGSASSAVAGAGPTQVGTHTILPAPTVPWLSVEEAIAGNYEVFEYTDAVVNSLHLECEAAGYLSATFDLIAKTQAAGATKTPVPDFDTTPLMVGSTLSVTYNSVDLEAKAFNFDLTNNFEDDDFRLGSVNLKDLTPKRREVTGGFTIRPTSSALWRQAVYGSSVATSPQAGAAVKQALVIHGESYEVIGTSVSKYTVDISIPKVTLRPFEVSPSGDDVIEHDVEFQALQPDPAVPICTVVVKNALATVL